METIVCPYCECRVRVADVDREGGACPECGAMITGSLLLGPDRLGFDDEEEEEELLLGEKEELDEDLLEEDDYDQ